MGASVLHNVKKISFQAGQPSPGHHLPHTALRRDDKSRTAQCFQMATDRLSADAGPGCDLFVCRATFPDKKTEQGQAPGMGERPQCLHHLSRIAASSPFEAEGLQNCGRMFDQRVRLGIIPDPSPVASGRK
jgi:hypothetical protein